MCSLSCGISHLFSGAQTWIRFLGPVSEFAFETWAIFTVAKACVCVSVPVPVSMCFVFGLPFGMWNMPAFEVRSLWNENATQYSNTVEWDCVYFCLCVYPSVLWLMQSRSEFRFCLWLKTLLCTGCGPHGIQQPFHSYAKFFFWLCFYHLQVSWFLLHLSFLPISPVLCFISLFQGGPDSKLQIVPMQHSNRHLLGFSPEAETEAEMGPEALGSGPSLMADR